MKRTVLIFLTIAILIVCTVGGAVADDFTIHSGIVFGDTREEVKAKETLSLEEETATTMTYKGKVAGFDNTTIIYRFSEIDGTLFNAFYRFDRPYLIADQDEQTSVLEKALKTKYGKQIGKDHEFYSVWGEQLSVYFSYYTADNPYGKTESPNITKHSTWVIPYDNYKIRVTLIKECGFGGNHYDDIDYRIFTDEEIALMKETKNEAEQRIIDDL